MIPYSPHLLFILFGLSEVGLSLFKRAKGGAKSTDRGTLGLLWLVIGASIFCAMFLSHAAPQFAFEPSSSAHDLAFILFVAGVALRWWSIIHLGRFFTVNVAIAADQRVVDDGPYRLLRHPSYTGALLAFIGLGLMLENVLCFFVLVLPVLVMFLWRIAVEERALLAALGPAYAEYCKRTKRLIPFIY